MADITATVFIEDALRSHSGGVFVLKTAEPHRRKNDRDEWVTESRTFRDVKVSRESGISLDTFNKGDRVVITGQEKTETREANGKKFFSLVVWASSIVPAERGGQQQAAPAADAWAAAEDAPF